MTGDNPPDKGECCPVCGCSDAAVIEMDRPVVYLCECARCGKWIIGARTLTALRQDAEFEKCREKISAVIRKHFNKSHRPLEIIEDGGKGTTPSAITISQLLKLAR
jgi:hypothetical protein